MLRINPHKTAPEYIHPDSVPFLRQFGFQETRVWTATFMGWEYYYQTKQFGLRNFNRWERMHKESK